METLAVLQSRGNHAHGPCLQQFLENCHVQECQECQELPTCPDSMVRRQAPVRGFHSFTSPAAADSPTASSLDSANARGPERCPGASMAPAFLGSSSSLMDHACQPAFHC